MLSAAQEKVNFMVRGMGMNAPDYVHIEAGEIHDSGASAASAGEPASHLQALS